jgi:hypothetical protein
MDVVQFGHTGIAFELDFEAETVFANDLGTN